MVRAVLLLPVVGFLAFGFLASCGADGAPVAPGVTMSGSASVGIARDGG